MLRTTRLLLAATCFAALTGCSPPQQAPAPETPPATTEAANATGVVVNGVSAGDRVTSPLVVEGTAPGDW